VTKRLVVALFLDLGRLTDAITQVVELGTTNVASSHDLDLVDGGAVLREGSLDTDAEAELANLEGLASASATNGDDNTLEHLHTLAATFDDLHVDLDGVAGSEIGDVITLLRCFNDVDQISHGCSSEKRATIAHRRCRDVGERVCR